MTEQSIEEKLRQAEARISELESALYSGEQLYKIIDASPVPYALNDEALNISYLNPAFINTFGYDRDDIPTLNDWWPKAYPDEDYRHWVAETWTRHLNKAKQTGNPFVPIEINIQCKSGEVRTVLASAASLTGSYAGNHLVILYDISKRKKMEKALQEQGKELEAIINHIPHVVFIKEATELRYVLFNKAGENLTGIKSKEILGKNDYDIWPREQAEFFIENDRAVLKSGQLKDIPDEPVDTYRGTRSMHTRKVTINDENGEPKYLLGISEDITDLKAARKETARMQKELQQVHKMESLGHLTGGIAHDFNNLLGIITGFTELSYQVAAAEENEQLQKYLQQVKNASSRATNLVSQMLSFSRSDQTEINPIRLQSLIKDDIDMLRATLPTSIEIDSQIEPSLPPVLMNETQLNQLLMNLTVNARDAMKGKGRISIKLYWAQGLNTESNVSHKPVTGDWVALSVSDNGSGIPADIVEDIFTPFFTTKDVGKGTGMGLSVIYGIMQSHNGHILFDTTPDKGTTFTLLFPPCDTKLSDLEATQEGTAPGNTAGLKIMVVDDERSLALLMEEFLTMNQYQVEAYTDSQKALDEFVQRSDEFSFLITDQTMPNMTGLELAAKFRAIKADIHVIICSGYSDMLDPDVLATENIHFFNKPIKMNELLSTLPEILNE